MSAKQKRLPAPTDLRHPDAILLDAEHEREIVGRVAAMLGGRVAP